MSDLSPTGYLICGGYGGIMYVLASHPLDTLKVRMQLMTSKKAKLACRSLTTCFRRSIAREGITSLYKGMGSSLLVIVPSNAATFSGFGIGMYLLGSHTRKIHNSYIQYFLSGCFSALISTIVVAPGERIKCLMQTQIVEKYTGSLDCLIKSYKEGGMYYVYRGIVATLVRDVPANGIYFLTYEGMVDYLTDYGSIEITTLETIACGGLAGLMYWIVAMPADVVKTIYQTSPAEQYKHGSWSIFKTILREEGIRGLFRGTIPILLTAIPANAACFLGFEHCRTFIAPWFVKND